MDKLEAKLFENISLNLLGKRREIRIEELQREITNLKKWRIDYEDLPELMVKYTEWYCDQRGIHRGGNRDECEAWLKGNGYWP